jgi:proline dehydrogenase
MPLLRTLFLNLSRSRRLSDLATGLPLAQKMARRFVAGEKLDESIAAVQALNRQGLLATLDHLGENVSTPDEARSAVAVSLDLLDAIESSGVLSGISVKPTQFGLDLSPALAAEGLEAVAARAEDAGRFVRLDMESHAYVDATLGLFEELWPRHRNLGVVIQAYLHRSAADVARLVHMGASVRLVKGAYDEPPDVAFAAKADTDANYRRLLEVLLGDEALAKGGFPAIATHDLKMIDWAKEHARQHGISPSRFEFQMLYGIRTGLQKQLAAEGYRVRAYVPYGRQWYPYFMRRMAERPANVLFLVRNLLRA